MSNTHVGVTITLGDEPPEVKTFPAHPVRAFATVTLGDDEAVIVVHSEGQAYALIGVLRDAARFLEDADPNDLRTTTEAEADFQAALARAALALPGVSA